jgi:hypothetical protein
MEKVITLPSHPYLQNIVKEYHTQCGGYDFTNYAGEKYRDWLKQFGFKVPVHSFMLEFNEDFTEEDLLAFILRWG